MEKDSKKTALISKYLNGNISKSEEVILVKWILEDDSNYQFFLNERIKFEEEGSINLQTEMAWKRFQLRISETKKQQRISKFVILRRVASVAAILIVGMLLYKNTISNFELLNNQFQEVSALNGHKSKVLLPDGSEVWLNSNSSLRYDLRYNNGHRTVYLKGEGYFDIVKNRNSQFKVITDDVDIKVFGTSFNVNAYEDSEQVIVSLLEGSIKLSTGDDKKEITELVPGIGAFYNKESKQIELKEINAENDKIWIHNKMLCQNLSIQELTKKLEKWYGVRVILQGDFENTQKYNFIVKTESLREVLELISFMTPINYKIEEGDKVIIKKRELMDR